MLITHVSKIRNGNYGKSIEYLKNKHNEIKNGDDIVKYEPILDENGQLIERENYSISYLKSDGETGNFEDWKLDCYKMDAKYNKNKDEDDIKVHQYLISYPEEDTLNGLTVEKAQKIAEDYCRKYFKGHQCLIATHGDTDNIHSHLVVHSIRDREIEVQDYMTKCEDGVTIKPSQYSAGGKLTATNKFNEFLMQGVSEYEKKYNVLNQDYAKKAEENKKEKKTKKESTRDRLHYKVLEVAQRSMNEDELQKNLNEIGIEYKRENNRIKFREIENADDKNKKNSFSSLQQIGLKCTDLTPDLYKYEEKKTVPQMLRENVLKAASMSENENDLINNLKKLGVDYKVSRGAISVRLTPTEENGRKGQYTRLNTLTLTPLDLPEDLHKYYDSKRDDKILEQQKKLQEKEYKETKEREIKDYLYKEMEYLNNNKYSKKDWINSKNFKPYTISKYNDEGMKRTLLEHCLILAAVVITNEMPEWALTHNQRMAKMKMESRDELIHMMPEKKIDNLKKALNYAKELNIDTPKTLAERLQNNNLSEAEKEKLEFLKEQYTLANDKEYCYSKIFRKRQDELKESGKKANELARKQRDDVHQKGLDKKKKKDKLKEREEYEKEISVAEKSTYFRMLNEARGQRTSEVQNSGPSRSR